MMRNLLMITVAFLMLVGWKPIGWTPIRTTTPTEDVIYCDATQGGAGGVVAGDLPVYIFVNPGINGSYEEIKVRFIYYNDGELNKIVLNFEAMLSNRPPGSAVPMVRLQAGNNNAEYRPRAATTWARGAITVDISGQSRGMYEGFVSLLWANSLDNGDHSKVRLRYVEVGRQ